MMERRVKRRVKGGRKKILPVEQRQMMEMYVEGHSLKAIGRELGRHWQTVEKYVRKGMASREGEEIRREALKEALVEHYRDLIRALQAVRDCFVLPDARSDTVPLPKELGRQDRLLLEQLRQVHAKDSQLWASWDSWEDQMNAFGAVLSGLRDKIAKRVTEEAEKVVSEMAAQKLHDNFIQVLLDHACGVARGSSSVLTVGLLVHDGQLWLGNSTQLSRGGNPEAARQLLLDLAEEMTGWGEVVGLARLLQSLASLLDIIQQEIDILVLRRAFPGHCRLCPV